MLFQDPNFEREFYSGKLFFRALRNHLKFAFAFMCVLFLLSVLLLYAQPWIRVELLISKKAADGRAFGLTVVKETHAPSSE